MKAGPPPPVEYLRIAVHTTPEAVEAVSYHLQRLGAGGVEIRDEARDEAGDRAREELPVVVVAYFPPEHPPVADDILAWTRQLSEFGLNPGDVRVEIDRIPEEAWAESWKQYYRPLPVGRRFIVCPSWEIPPRDEFGGRIRLVLDPGQAFGTGQHPTTRLAVELLEEVVMPGHRLLDAGCGSGILTLAGLALGASEVVALDIDPVACRVARQNWHANRRRLARLREEQGLGSKPRVRFINGSWESLRPGAARPRAGDPGARARPRPGPFDVVVANILADVLVSLAADLPWLLAPEGTFLGSGIINSKAHEVEAALTAAGYSVVEWRADGEWRAVRARGASRAG
ncbi:MAG TPA: methyltransferase [Firmicutes bacterium]|nr:methyltransferase [Bacillota bacterium]